MSFNMFGSPQEALKQWVISWIDSENIEAAVAVEDHLLGHMVRIKFVGPKNEFSFNAWDEFRRNLFVYATWPTGLEIVPGHLKEHEHEEGTGRAMMTAVFRERKSR